MAGWARHGCLYEFSSIDGSHNFHSGSKNPKMAAWTDTLIRKFIHAPGTPTVGMRIWPQLRTIWPYVDYYGLRDAFVIRYAPGEQESLRIHHDVAQVSGSIKLNDGYRGAELSFPRQGFDNGSVEVGEMLVWPSLVTHPHETRQLTDGVKYALTVWFELPSF